MKSKWKKLTGRIAALAVMLLTFITMLWGGNISAPVAFAEDTPAYDATNVLDDLEGAEIDGKAFDLKDYPFDEKRDTAVLLFAEYCYSFYYDKQGNYGLYLYVYNPQGLVFDTGTGRNTVTLAVGDTSEYAEYTLEYLNRSERTNYEGLFYKFKVRLTNAERTEILDKLNSTERFYHVSGAELLEAGQINPKDITVNAEYRYSGYAAGYGSLNSSVNNNTLTYTKLEGEVYTVGEEGIRQTFYRPEGSNGTNSYTQDTLQSVYFAVPDRYFESYGILSRVLGGQQQSAVRNVPGRNAAALPGLCAVHDIEHRRQVRVQLRRKSVRSDGDPVPCVCVPDGRMGNGRGGRLCGAVDGDAGMDGGISRRLRPFAQLYERESELAFRSAV